MKTLILISTYAFLLLLITSCGDSCGDLISFEDEVTMETVVIGEQTWQSRNLNVDRFRNGDLIQEAKTNEEWLKANEDKEPAWCYYDNKEENGEIYGKLYNWYAITDPRGLVPEEFDGFEISSDSDWKELTDFLKSAAGKKLKATTGWPSDGNGSNDYGFTALPGGMRAATGKFSKFNETGYWWTSTPELTGTAWYRSMSCEDDNVNRVSFSKGNGYSIRLVEKGFVF